jgi:3-oxoadipate enol-lactonase
MTSIEVAGGQLSAQVDGEGGAKPWIIMSNAIGTDRTMWDDQVRNLMSDFRVIRYDTRGHGRSDPIPGPYNFEILVDDVEAILDYYQVSRATFIGLSLGGMTGLGVAMRRPDRIHRLVCCNARADAPQAFASSWDDRIAAIEHGGMDAIVQASLERWLSARTLRDQPAMANRVADGIRQTSIAGYTGCAGALKGLRFLERLKSITCPVMYLAGADDLAAPPDVMQRMADETPKSIFAVLPHCAHLSNLDQPVSFLEAVRQFLSDGGN